MITKDRTFKAYLTMRTGTFCVFASKSKFDNSARWDNTYKDWTISIPAKLVPNDIPASKIRGEASAVTLVVPRGRTHVSEVKKLMITPDPTCINIYGCNNCDIGGFDEPVDDGCPKCGNTEYFEINVKTSGVGDPATAEGTVCEQGCLGCRTIFPSPEDQKCPNCGSDEIVDIDTFMETTKLTDDENTADEDNEEDISPQAEPIEDAEPQEDSTDEPTDDTESLETPEPPAKETKAQRKAREKAEKAAEQETEQAPDFTDTDDTLD